MVQCRDVKRSETMKMATVVFTLKTLIFSYIERYKEEFLGKLLKHFDIIDKAQENANVLAIHIDELTIEQTPTNATINLSSALIQPAVSRIKDCLENTSEVSEAISCKRGSRCPHIKRAHNIILQPSVVRTPYFL